MPRSLWDALDALAADHAFLTKGEVLPASFINSWVQGKRINDSFAVAIRPHPYEFEIYLDV